MKSYYAKSTITDKTADCAVIHPVSRASFITKDTIAHFQK